MAFKKIRQFFSWVNRIRRSKLIRKLVKVVADTKPTIKKALADGVITEKEKKEIVKELILNIIEEIFGNEKNVRAIDVDDIIERLV